MMSGASQYQSGYRDGKQEREGEVRQLQKKLEKQPPRHTLLWDQAETMTVAELARNVGLDEFVITLHDSYE